jgi:acyl-CoA synthetase (AMP-forming)/AMP-acid ligase II
MPDAALTREQVIAELTAPGGPYEVETVNIRGVDLPVIKTAPKTLRDLYDSVRPETETTFLVYEDERYSFAEAYDKAATLAHRMRDRFGIRPGDRVAIAMRNYPEWCFAFMAATSMGAIAVTLNAWWQGRELEYGLRDSGAKLLFADQERLDRVEPFLPDLDVQAVVARPTRPASDPVSEFDSLLSGTRARDFPAAQMEADDDAAIMYTSGSTGTPKGVITTHRGVISALVTWEFGLELGLRLFPEYADPDPEFPPSMLLSIPLFHVSGSHVQFLMSFRRVRKLVMMYRWDPEKALELIEKERITEFNGVPTMTGDLVNSPDFDKRDLRSLKGIGGGGSARPAEQVRRIRERLVDGFPGTGYGLTETNAIATTISGELYLERPTSVGRASAPLVDIRIVDEQDQPLPPGEVGAIQVKSCVNMRGYWRDPEGTAAAFCDGWLRTGDIGTLDEEGFLYITDRAKDIVIRGGENISCLEVEDILHEHPAVLEAVVFGVPDQRLGEVPAAVVVTRPGHATSENELKQHVGEHLASFKVPAHVWLRTELLPRIASGKFAKRQLRDEARGWLAEAGD